MRVADARSTGCVINKGATSGLIGRKDRFLIYTLFILLMILATTSVCLQKSNKLSKVTPRILWVLIDTLATYVDIEFLNHFRRLRDRKWWVHVCE